MQAQEQIGKMKKIKEQCNFNRTTIEPEFKPYIATFRKKDCFEIVIKDFSNRNIFSFAYFEKLCE